MGDIFLEEIGSLLGGVEAVKGMIRLDSPLAKELGFTSDKFDGYLWQKDNTIIISLIISRQEGQGHLSSLFNEIWARGYTIRVPTPSSRMRAILEKKGFKQKWIYDNQMGSSVEIYERGPSNV